MRIGVLLLLLSSELLLCDPRSRLRLGVEELLCRSAEEAQRLRLVLVLMLGCEPTRGADLAEHAAATTQIRHRVEGSWRASLVV